MVATPLSVWSAKRLQVPAWDEVKAKRSITSEYRRYKSAARDGLCKGKGNELRLLDLP
jgi:hypothetical protein